MEWSKRERCCSREYSPSISLFILNLFHRGIMVRLSSPPSLFFRFFPFGHALTCASVRSPSVPSTSSTGWLVLFFFVSAVAGFLLTLAAAAATRVVALPQASQVVSEHRGPSTTSLVMSCRTFPIACWVPKSRMRRELT